MTLDAAEECSLTLTQGDSKKSARLLLPITLPAHCDHAADGGTTRVLGNFGVVSGHAYVWAWYLGMHRAMQNKDTALVAALWQMALTTSVHLRHGLSESQRACWSISHAEQARFTEGVMGDSFPAFALKCLAVLEVLPLCHHGATTCKTTSVKAEDPVSVRTAITKLLDAKVVFRGAKVNATMANAVLTLRTSISSGSMRLFANIENQHGRARRW